MLIHHSVVSSILTSSSAQAICPMQQAYNKRQPQ